MNKLPKVPLERLDPHAGRYLLELVRQLEDELAHRPSTKGDGVLYIHEGQQLRLISPNGSIYDLSVNDAGALVTTPVTL